MIIVLHRSECALGRRDRLMIAWIQHRFAPSPRATWEREGAWKWRTASVPVAIAAPIGSRVHQVGRQQLLATHFDPVGLTADSVAYLAARGERGFRLAPEAVLMGT